MEKKNKIDIENDTKTIHFFLNTKRERNENENNEIISEDNKIKKTNNELRKCKECGKENVKFIKNTDEFINYLFEEVIKFKFNTINIEIIKNLFLNENIIINNLCKECICKEIILSGVLKFIKKINNIKEEIPNLIYQYFINSFLKKLEDINESNIKNSIEIEEVINKITLDILDKNKSQFLQFNEKLNLCKNLLKNNKDSYLNLYNSILEENEMFKKTITLINDDKMKNEKIQNLINQIKELNKTEINDNQKLINQNNEMLLNNLKNLSPTTSFENQINNNIHPFNSFDFSKIINSQNNNNILFQSLNPNILLDYPSFNCISNNNFYPQEYYLNNQFNDFKNTSNFSDNNPLMINNPLNQYNKYCNIKHLFFPSTIQKDKLILDNINYKSFNQIIPHSTNLNYNYNYNLNNENKNILESQTGSLKNMFNELAKQKDIKKVNKINK